MPLGTVHSRAGRVDPSFWQGRRVLVTGHTGFKGAWLCLWLQSLGAHVCGASLGVPTDPCLYELARVAEGMAGSAVCDIRDAAAVSRAVAQAGPQIVFHLAAQSLVRRSFAAPRETYETNAMGTVNVLEAVRACPSVEAVVVVTSDKCYENREAPTPTARTTRSADTTPTPPPRPPPSLRQRPTGAPTSRVPRARS